MLKIEEAFPGGVAAVMRHSDSEVAFHACMAAVEGGIRTVEVTTSVPDHLELVRGLVASAGVPVGVGTVWDPGAAEEAHRAGASFIVTPVLLPEVAEACRRIGILCVLGALTPTEIYQARVAGADLVKIFPIASVGGPRYVELVTGPMGLVPLWVSGGVEIDEVPAYLKLGVKAVGLTTAIFPTQVLRSGDVAPITELARRASALVAAR